MRRIGMAVILALALPLSACAGGRPPVSTGPASASSDSLPRESATSPATTSPGEVADRNAGHPAVRDTSRSAAPRSSASSPSSPPPSLAGDTRNAWAFAPLSDPGRITVEGDVPLDKAYSTSKVLIVCAYVATVAGGDPAKLSRHARDLIRRALTASEMTALLELQNAIPSGAQRPITAILREIGDHTTQVPGSTYGGMLWTPREQVRFMAALARGRVVNPAVSRYVRTAMKPIPQHSWGLGRIGATSFKGGWLRADTVTRQMGIVDGYAVALITDAVGPAVLQTDGDYAHVAQVNSLARQLERRLRAEGG